MKKSKKKKKKLNQKQLLVIARLKKMPTNVRVCIG